MKRVLVRGCQVLVLLVISYELAANIALWALIFGPERDMRIRVSLAYTLVPGEIVAKGVRAASVPGGGWNLTARRIELSGDLLDWVRGKRTADRVRVHGMVFEGRVPTRSPAAAHIDDPKTSTGKATEDAVPQGDGVWFEHIATMIADATTLDWSFIVRDAELNARGIVVSAVTSTIDWFELPFQSVTLMSDGKEIARVRGSLEGEHLMLRKQHATAGKVELKGGLLPVPGSRLRAEQALELTGDITLGRNWALEAGFTSGAAVELSDSSGTWRLPRGFTASLRKQPGREPQGTLSTPNLSYTSDAGVSLQCEKLELTVAPETLAGAGLGLNADLGGQQVTLVTKRHRFVSPLSGEVVIGRTSDATGGWAIRSGTVELDALRFESAADTAGSVPVSARLELVSETAPGPGVSALGARLAMTGPQLKPLVGLLSLPETARWMLSRFDDQPFRVTAAVRRGSKGTTLSDIELASGDLRVTGALWQPGTSLKGALVISARQVSFGVRLDEAGTLVSWGADREWLRTQLEQLLGSDVAEPPARQ